MAAPVCWPPWEPRTGQRLVQVRARRTRPRGRALLEGTGRALSCGQEDSPGAGPPPPSWTPAVSTKPLPRKEAFALAQRFECFHTPRSASGLNMIAGECSALARECLHRRLPSIEGLAREGLALVRRAPRQGQQDHLAVFLGPSARQVRPPLPARARRGAAFIRCYLLPIRISPPHDS